MKEKILRRLFLGFTQVHILYHAQQEPVYGAFMINELKNHGYNISAGTLYPIINNLAEAGLLEKSDRVIEGKVRKYYTITPAGTKVLTEAKEKAEELVREIREN